MRGVEERRGEERIYAVSELPPVRLLWSGSAGTGREIRLARLAGPALLSPGTANGVVWQRETRWRLLEGFTRGNRREEKLRCGRLLWGTEGRVHSSLPKKC